MLQRENYKEDHCLAYFPNYSNQKYFEYLVRKKPFYYLMLTKNQQQRWSASQNQLNTAITFTFLLSLIPVVLHKHIPLLKRYTSRSGRFLWGLFFILIPSNLCAFYITSKNQQKMMLSYQLSAQDFKNYRQTLDLQVINPQIKFAQF